MQQFQLAEFLAPAETEWGCHPFKAPDIVLLRPWALLSEPCIWNLSSFRWPFPGMPALVYAIEAC